jgi:hypothetical protein
MKLFIALAAFLLNPVSGFAGPQHHAVVEARTQGVSTSLFQEANPSSPAEGTRRSLLVGATMAAAAALISSPDSARAAVGTLTELQDTNAILQGITVRVTDPAQQKQMISFLQLAFDMDVVRGTPDGLDTVSYCLGPVCCVYYSSSLMFF